MKPKELIDNLVKAYNCKDITDLCNKLNLSYPTISRYHTQSNITKRGYIKEYLKLLLEHKKVLDELEEHQDFIRQLSKLQNYLQDK